MFAAMALSGCCFLHASAQSPESNESSNWENQGNKLNSLLYHIENIYVEDVDLESLVETAIVKMLEEMDPHSVYIPAEDYKLRMNLSTVTSKVLAFNSTFSKTPSWWFPLYQEDHLRNWESWQATASSR